MEHIFIVLNRQYIHTRNLRILSRLTDELNLFLTQRNLESWIKENKLYCVCNKTEQTAEAFCSPSQYLDCKLDKDITGQQCHITSRRRRRSANGNKDTELERLMQLMTPVERHRLFKVQTCLYYDQTKYYFITSFILATLYIKCLYFKCA